MAGFPRSMRGRNGFRQSRKYQTSKSPGHQAPKCAAALEFRKREGCHRRTVDCGSLLPLCEPLLAAAEGSGYNSCAMKTRHLLLLLPAIFIPLALIAQGPLTPPGGPAPTGKTLQQIEP